MPIQAPAIPLTTEAFHATVLALSPALAVFDCDGTLWSGDAGSGFMDYTIKTGLLSREAVAWLNSRYALYKQGQLSEVAICGEMLQVYAGHHESTLRTAAHDFFSTHIEHQIFPEMRKLVANLQAQGTELWAVSSTNDWAVEEGLTRFGIPPERVLCARIAIENGLVTDRLLDVPTGPGKVDALFRVSITAPDAVFGNSVHDAAMLAVARQAFSVNPTPALLERSIAEGWPVYFPAVSC